MKKFSFIKLAALITVLTVLISVMSIYASARVSPSDKALPTKGDYELPVKPIETEHDWDEGVVTTPPTCTEPGVRTYTCRINTYHTYTEEIPPTGHTPAEGVRENEKSPTCETEGSYDEVVYCSVCGVELSREPGSIPANDHDWDAGVTISATCVDQGYELYTCTVCGKTKTLPVDGPLAPHTWDEGVVTTASTYTSEGEKTYTCTVCGDTKTETTEPLPAYIGDVDGDGVLNVKDISAIKAYIAGMLSYSEVIEKNIDIDGNGIISMMDISAIKLLIAG